MKRAKVRCGDSEATFFVGFDDPWVTLGTHEVYADQFLLTPREARRLAAALSRYAGRAKK